MNPYLPLYEYIPDGEPHIFGDRVYLYGSHDKFNGDVFCQNDYICYSASLDNLKDWRYEGVIFKKSQDPRNSGLTGADEHCLWAPDVVKGPDGRYYLYYCMDVLREIGVAVCDSPAGAYEFLGFVRHVDGTPLGQKEGDLGQFDPGLFIDEDRSIYLYSGNSPRFVGIARDKHSQVMTLEEDMLTLKEEPRLLLPDVYEAEGSAWVGHEFFEASSLRKINGKYYLIYSDVQSNFLSYAISDYPDKGYEFAGPLISLGDVEFHGRSREKARNFLGNTHGSIECIKGQWYVFYHRQTNRHLYSRQACAEKIDFDSEGKIILPCMTSLGFDGDSLPAKGSYSAAIACNLWGKRGIYEYQKNMHEEEDYPYFTQEGPDREEAAAAYIANMQDGAVAGYKYYEIDGECELSLTFSGKAQGRISVFAERAGCTAGSNGITESSDRKLLEDRTDSGCPAYLGEIITEATGESKEKGSCRINLPRGRFTLYLEYSGCGSLNLYELSF